MSDRSNVLIVGGYGVVGRRIARLLAAELGVHTGGGSEALKREATADLIAFLKKYGF